MSASVSILLVLLAVLSLCVGIAILAYRTGHTQGQIDGINIARKNVNVIGGHLK